jgi:2-phosphosulfolactate phosphatase
MQINFGYLLEGAKAARGTAVIIDVFRAFTCTPLMFSLGLKKSILVSQPQEALALKHRHQDYILVGEVDGLPVEGFDLGNSPSEILGQKLSFFTDKTAVQRTSAGVQGALTALEVADEVLVASYNVARATAKYILSRQPAQVSEKANTITTRPCERLFSTQRHKDFWGQMKLDFRQKIQYCVCNAMCIITR